MKKSMKNLEIKTIDNRAAVKGGNGGKKTLDELQKKLGQVK